MPLPDRLPAEIANWKGAWALSTAYTEGDAVSTGTPTSSYVCTVSHTSGAASEPGVGGSWATYWDLMAEAGTNGVAGELVGSGAWTTPTGYTADVDVVENDGSGYVCKASHTSGDHDDEPGVGAVWETYWELLVSKGDVGSQGIQGETGSQGIQGIQGDKGDTGQLVGSGAWTTATPYVADVDVVENDGSGYVCKASHTSGDLDDEPGVGAVWATYWDLLVSKGDQGDQGIQGPAGGGLTDVVDDTSPTLGGDLNAAGNDIADLGKLNFDDATELTIAGGAVTATQAYHTIDTESDDASDDLDTINGDVAGDVLYLRAADGARTVVLKHGTGNILISGDADYSLDDATKEVQLHSDGTNWHMVGSAGGGAGSDTTAIHDNVSAEISAITEKTEPVAADLLLIEDSAASNAKKRVQVGNLPGGADFLLVQVFT